MPEQINDDRRCLIGAAAMTAAAAPFGLLRAADAQSGPSNRERPPVSGGADTSLGPLKHIDAGVLNIAYAETGPTMAPW
jgi:hypothetical protein